MSTLRWAPLALLLVPAASLRVPKPLVRTGNDAIWLLNCLKLRSAGCRLGTDLELKQSGSKGQGLFAARSIEEGSLIGRYNGELLSEDEYDAKLLQMVSGQGMYVMDMGNGYILGNPNPSPTLTLTWTLTLTATLTHPHPHSNQTARTLASRRSCATSTTLCAGQTAERRRWWTRTTRARSPPWPLWRRGTLPWARS